MTPDESLFVDAHVHLDMYGEQLPGALEEMRSRRILTLAVSMDVSSFSQTEHIAAAEPLVIPAFGIHPWNAPAAVRDLGLLEPLIERAPVLGEVGLDHHFVKDKAAHSAQRTVFEYFLEAARRTGKPLNIHSKGAEEECAGLLESYGSPRAILHWYSGPVDMLDRLIGLGVYFSMGVGLLRSRHVEAIARRIPHDRLLTETDNPGAWAWMEKKPGYPRLLEDVITRLADVRTEPLQSLKDQICYNFSAALGPRPQSL